jgi:predicted nucleotidyltransferase
MLTKQSIKNQLQATKPQIMRFGISKIGLFGSFVKEEAKPDSDIDILIDFAEGQETFDNFINACYFLDDLFKDIKVDVVTVNGLSPYIGPYILKEVEYV